MNYVKDQNGNTILDCISLGNEPQNCSIEIKAYSKVVCDMDKEKLDDFVKDIVCLINLRTTFLKKLYDKPRMVGKSPEENDRYEEEKVEPPPEFIRDHFKSFSDKWGFVYEEDDTLPPYYLNTYTRVAIS